MATTLHFHVQSDLWALRRVRLARLPGSCFWLLSVVDCLVLPWGEDGCMFTRLGRTAGMVAPVLSGALGGYWQDHKEAVLLSWPTVCWALVVHVNKSGPQSLPSSQCPHRKGPLGVAPRDGHHSRAYLLIPRVKYRGFVSVIFWGRTEYNVKFIYTIPLH